MSEVYANSATPVNPQSEDSDEGQTVQDEATDPSYFTMIPNIVLTLGLSPYALALYIHLKKVTGETAVGVCFKKTATLADELNMSAGSISAAKKELAMRREELGGHSGKNEKKNKSLITITERKNRNGGKPLHHITITNIWTENRAAFARPAPSSPDARASSPDEIASSPDARASSYSEIASSYNELAISPDEIKKNPSEEKPVKKNHTHTRASGAPEAVRAVAAAPSAGVCVGSVFSFEERKRYANNHQLRGGWLTNSRSGEYDEMIAAWFAEQGIAPAISEAASLAAPPAPPLNTAECPDCHGTGWTYPQGFGSGVAKCAHTALIARVAA